MNQKTYEPVAEFEQQTTYCPLYLAWQVVDEARDYFRVPIPEAYADRLAHRAEVVFTHHSFWQRRFKSVRGREAILTSMRHWLAGVLARENPVLFRQLPESFKIGAPLPSRPNPLPEAPRRKSRITRPISRFVHGCELLVI